MMLQLKLQEQENILQHCVKQLESAEASRVALFSVLKAAIDEQETKLGIIHHRLQASRGGIGVVGKIKQKLSKPQISLDTMSRGITEPAKVLGHGQPTVQATTSGFQFPGNQSTPIL